MDRRSIYHKITWIIVFGITMGFFEAAVVVYLRAIYYPEGFAFPLKAFKDYKIVVEVFREIASIVMLMAVAAIAGRKFWERFAFFLISFAVWDIFYYIFLKIALDWPPSVFTWDILFLIPIPWIGPVIAPVSISLIMIAASLAILKIYESGGEFSPPAVSYVISIIATIIILYSFTHDIAATLYQKLPQPYNYSMLIIGNILYIAAFALALQRSTRPSK